MSSGRSPARAMTCSTALLAGGQHDDRVDGRRGGGDDAGARREARGARRPAAVAEQQQRGRVRHGGGGAHGVQVLDPVERPGMPRRGEGDGVLAAGAQLGEGGRQGGEALQRSCRGGRARRGRGRARRSSAGTGHERPPEGAVGPGLRPPCAASRGRRRRARSRVKPSSVALRSAAMPMCTEPMRRMRARVGLQRAAVGEHRHRARRSRRRRQRRAARSPARTRAAVWPTASMPEAQKRLIVPPGTWSPQPATSAAVRARLAPCSSTWVAQPSITSSTVSTSSPVRSTRARCRCTTRSMAVRPCSASAARRAARGGCGRTSRT